MKRFVFIIPISADRYLNWICEYSFRSPTSTVQCLTNGSYLSVKIRSPRRIRKWFELMKNGWWLVFYVDTGNRDTNQQIIMTKEKRFFSTSQRINRQIDDLDPFNIQYLLKEQLYVFVALFLFLEKLKMKQWFESNNEQSR